MTARRPNPMLNRWSAFGHDLLWIPVALGLAYWLRFDLGPIPEIYVHGLWTMLAIALPVQTAAFWLFGLYRGIWRFASVPDLMRILRAVWIGVGLSFLAYFLVGRLEGMPRSIMLLYPVMLTMGLTGPRLIYRWIKDRRFTMARDDVQRALILGAGRAGELLARDLLRDRKFQPIAFLDDAAKNLGREVHGIRVIGSTDELEVQLERLAIDVVLVALARPTPGVMRRIVDVCAEKSVRCVTLPALEELPESQVGISQLREVRIEDLLGREAVSLDAAGVHTLLSGKRVLITGAGGSIGSELCRQVSRHGLELLLLLDSGEFNLYRIEREMAGRPAHGEIKALLGDVRDPVRMQSIFEEFRPHIVLHAAAYKQVPLVEANPVEGLTTNVFGTRVVADLARKHGVEKFLLVSTDKAVNPTNVMGASKRLAEIYCQAMNNRGATAFITTRFGNVLGSAGSVVPLFRRQIEKGGPVTVTHPEITRFFMTIPEAVSLTLQAAAMGGGGEIFVLEMGRPVKILDLAREMIRLSGHVPDKDIDIEFIGLRPGEKLHEELFHASENLLGTHHPNILLAQARETEWRVVQNGLVELATAGASHSVDVLQHLMQRLVPEYRPFIAGKPEGSRPGPDTVRLQ
jgi:FlaA1/EpsC-like NDP-sugar epimerase